MTTLTATMTPRCLGRYIVDLPTAFVLLPNSLQRILVEDVEIKVEAMAESKFVAMLQKRTNELSNARLMPAPHYPMLHESYPISDADGFGTVFNRAESEAGSGGRTTRLLELRAWKNGYAFAASIKARDIRFPEDADNKGLQELGTDVPEKLVHLLAVYKRTQGRVDTDIPSAQGMCIPNGFIHGQPSDNERLVINYYLKDAPDVSITFHSLSNIGSDNELLDRGEAIEKSLKKSSCYTIRKGHLHGQLAGAQEWLMSRKPSDNLPSQHFTLEANGKAGSALAPLVVLNFTAGSRIPEGELSLDEIASRKPLSTATLNESQAIVLWDVMAPTLRPRPGAF